MIETQPSSSSKLVDFADFLTALARSLEREGLRLCVLRNYESFPASKTGNDIDCLIRPSEEDRVARALRALPGIAITDYVRRHYASNFFLAGINSGSQARGIQLDFAVNLLWKGLPILDVDSVLNAAHLRPIGEATCYVPAPVHSAIAIAMHDLLYGGALKQKYFSGVQRAFVEHRDEVLATLRPQFGNKMAERLTDAVTAGQLDGVAACSRPLRVSFVLRALYRSPFRNSLALMQHHYDEIKFRFSRDTMQSIYLRGLNSGKKKLILDALMPMLPGLTALRDRVNLSPRFVSKSNASETDSTNSAADSNSAGYWASIKGVALCLARNWHSRFSERKNSTLRIVENSYDDFLLDPRRFGYRGPLWLARLAGRLMPSPNYSMLLDVPTGSAAGKRKAKCIVLDSSLPPEQIAEDAYASIVDALAPRAVEKLKRFR